MDRSRIYKVRGKRWKGAVGLCLAAVLAMAVLTGCSRKAAATTGSRTVDKEYTKGQMMVIAITERNRYQNIYTSELWSVKADENGDTFEDKLMDQVEQFLIELAATNLMADEQGIELTSQEKDSLKSLAQEYYRNLSEQDRRFMDVSEDEVYDLYCQYYRADKLVAELTKNENLEVSDAEAKVIGIQQIELDSRAEAENVLALAQAEKADFGAIAAKYSKDSRTDRTLERKWMALKELHLSWSRTRSAGFWSRAEDIISLSVSMPMTRRLRLPERAGWPRRRRQRRSWESMSRM